MVYNLRDRNLLNSRGTYYGSSGSDDGSYDLDPDFGTPARRPRRSMPRAAGIRIPGSEGENSSWNFTGNMESMWPGRTSENRRRVIERNRRRNRPDVPIAKRSVLSWLISMGVVSENEEVWYLDAPWGNILVEGKVTREGIFCMCCSRLVTVGEFEAHAGWKTNKPYQHIILAMSLLSLFDCQTEAWEEKEEEERRKFNYIQPAPKALDTSDDACMICADGGDLICCESCPSTFHPNCIFMENLPQGDWLCFYCVCKYCGSATRILNECSQCDKPYHAKCGGEKLELMNPASTLFCGKTCRKRMVGVRNYLEDGLSWTLVQRRGQPWTVSCANDEYTRVECNSKIATAWQVMNECFLSTIDRHTRANILQSIVYNCGSNFTRINYSGFYTAVLEKGDEMISAASIRVHGKMLAEMPFIGTRGRYRRQGMARVLYNCIENFLCSLKIEKLVIPSMDERTSMWIDKYFFARVEDENLKQALSGYNMDIIWQCSTAAAETSECLGWSRF
ncbi:hypothetical protein GQ457_08G026060 [Hibiscus cannabinus]